MVKKAIVIVMLLAVSVVLVKGYSTRDVEVSSSLRWGEVKEGYRMTVVDNQGYVVNLDGAYLETE
ncbi:hypothetical protein [Anaerocolumna sp.]|uniref:hypothetical protein n=1 Tax=Anaerocolumna sp. TaxID=2041569 RepID=UPI0028A6578C|nr:hypothetical protein [Anaerocolumna sp.]